MDDLLTVIKNPLINERAPIDSFLNEYYGDIITSPDSQNYCINVESPINKSNLYIQKDKVVLLYFDKLGSKAGLDLLKEELDSKTSIVSDFYTEYLDKDLEYFAYHYLYDDRKDTVRNIVGLDENDTEFERFIHTHVLANKLCKFNNSQNIYTKILEFFTGINSLKFFRLWVRVYEYLFINNKSSEAESFHKNINNEIRKISSKYEIVDHLLEYNDISYYIVKSISLDLLKESLTELENTLPFAFRISNIFNHTLVGWSLINFSDYDGNLFNQLSELHLNNLDLNQQKITYSPRFITFDEFQLFKLLKFLTTKSLNKVNMDDPSNNELNFNHFFQESIDTYYHKDLISNYLSIECLSEESKSNKLFETNKIVVGKKISKEKLAIGIANFNVRDEDIVNNIRADKNTNISTERLQVLLNILSTAKDQKCDMLVLPEVSIPVRWLPFITEYSRKHQMGIIFGLEHWIQNKVAYNFIVEVLPFSIDNKYKYCTFTIRLKNHYAPLESSMISDFHLINPREIDSSKSYYHIIQWRGTQFSTYNCYELADITHRSIFKNKIDLLVACVFNKDTNYYNHIMESVVRDLHCYTVQVNTAQYGGSCVLRPSKTDSKTLIFVKGGENECVLKATLNMKNLRDFQFSKTGNNVHNSQSFKPVPPGFDYKRSVNNMNN